MWRSNNVNRNKKGGQHHIHIDVGNAKHVSISSMKVIFMASNSNDMLKNCLYQMNNLMYKTEYKIKI